MINQNIATIISLLKGHSAQDVLMSMLKQSPINDPIISQLIGYAKSGDNENFLNLATNYFQQRGLDINKEYNSFISMLK